MVNEDAEPIKDLTTSIAPEPPRRDTAVVDDLPTELQTRLTEIEHQVVLPANLAA